MNTCQIATSLLVTALIVCSEAASLYHGTDMRLPSGPNNLFQYGIPIEKFANNKLCRHLKGQEYLKKAMSTKMPNVKRSLLDSFVVQLCAMRGALLEMWVRELFDADGDGQLTHFEMHYYESNDV